MEIETTFTGVEAIEKVLSQYVQRFSKPMQHSFLKAAGRLQRKSIWENFKASGRPMKWKALQRPFRRKSKSGKLRNVNKPLMGKGKLKSSVRFYIIDGGDAVKIGTIFPVAAYHHFGATLWTGAILPARPFIMFQEEDVQAITQLAEDFIDGKFDRMIR